VFHCLNDLQILIFFFGGKLDIRRKPTLQGNGTNSLGESKGSPNNIMLSSTQVGTGDHVVSFPSCKGFLSWLATWLLAWGPARATLVLVPTIRVFLHPKKSFPLDPMQKSMWLCFSANKSLVLSCFSAGYASG